MPVAIATTVHGAGRGVDGTAALEKQVAATGGAGCCPEDGSPPAAEHMTAIPARSAFRVWHIALMSLTTLVAAATSAFTYFAQSGGYRRVFQDLGRSLPALTELAMNKEVVLALYGSIAATCIYVFLLARQRIRRGPGVGAWPGRILFWLLFLTLVLDAVIAEALHRPLIDLIESLR